MDPSDPREHGGDGQPSASGDGAARPAAPAAPRPAEHPPAARSRFYGSPLPRTSEDDLSGMLIVIEGTDGSGRSTQIALLQEWLESNGFAVQTMGLRRSNLIARDIDDVLAKNSVTRMTLALMYATDFFDQLENRIIPALRSGMIVLADRYFFTLVARAAARGIARGYLHGIYEPALRPDLSFWLNVSPSVAFEREFKKSQVISYWEAGLDMALSNDLFKSFIRYQSMIKKEFENLAKRHQFVKLDAEAPVQTVNRELRKHIGEHLRIKDLSYKPSSALIHLWR